MTDTVLVEIYHDKRIKCLRCESKPKQKIAITIIAGKHSDAMITFCNRCAWILGEQLIKFADQNFMAGEGET